jgi:tetratricopeptide (TPR) repeat protein
MTSRTSPSCAPAHASQVRPAGSTARGAAGLALMLVAAAGCRSADSSRSVEGLILQARYADAVDLAERRAADEPGSEAAARELDRARVAQLLDQARALNFADRFEESLALLDQAAAIIPEQPQVRDWRAKNLREMAALERDRAREAEASGDFETAYESYLVAARLDPSEPAGRAGAERVLLRANYRDGLGSAYYRKGVKELREYRTNQAAQSFESSQKYAGDDPRLVERRDEAAVLLAEERVEIAMELERQGLFRAARNEFRLALLVESGFGPALEGLERAEREVQVLEFLGEAERELRRGEFDQASLRVERAADLTEAQASRVDEYREMVEEGRLMALYDEARQFEDEFDFADAVSAYDRLIEESEGFFEDALSRRDTLSEYLELAPSLYQRAMAAESLEEQEALLYKITLFWPTYRDVRELRRALVERLALE